MNYYLKYIKYYTKYITLKKKLNISLKKKLNINQLGGTDINGPIIHTIQYSFTETTYKDGEDNKIHLTTITLNNEKLPVLFVIPGMSNVSYRGTSSVVLKKLDELKTKFKKIYLLEYSSFKESQIKACEKRNTLKPNLLIPSEDKSLLEKSSEEVSSEEESSEDKSSEDKQQRIVSLEEKNEIIYEPEFTMNNNIAEFINTIIIELKLKNIHLLGKCNGAWIATLILLMNEECDALYLAVPGIAPIKSGIKNLEELTIDRLCKINFIFGWTKQDIYPFDWNMKSRDEREVYDKIMINIQMEKKIILKYISGEYDMGCKDDPKIYHELHPDMISEILMSI